MNKHHNLQSTFQSHEGGFSLIELAIVLVVIGIILGMVSIGTSVHRSAQYQAIYARHISAWVDAYDDYYTRQSVVVGDSTTTPTLKVNSATDSPLCGTNIHTLMDAAGVEMPAGRAEGSEDSYAYLDHNGNPMEIQICFRNTAWTDSQGTSVQRNVMEIRGLVPDLARLLDSTIDSRPDARYGLFRESTQAAATTTTSTTWSIDSRAAFGGSTTSNKDEDQVAVVTAYYRMSN